MITTKREYNISIIYSYITLRLDNIKAFTQLDKDDKYMHRNF